MAIRPLLLSTLVMLTLPASRSDAKEVQVKTLPNGLLWIHKPVRHNRIMAFRVFFPGGSLREDAAKAGVTDLMTAVMFKGTAQRSALRIAQEAESLGAALNAGGEEDHWEMSGQVVSDKFPQLMDLFQDVLLNPSFPPDEFEKEKRAQLNDIRAKQEQIFSVAYDMLQAGIFGDHPYGRPAEGTEATVSALKREDLVRWHKKCISPQGAVFVTVGNVPAKKVEALLLGLCKKWPAGEPPKAAPADKPAYPAKPRLIEENRPFEQSYFMTAYPAPGSTTPDYAAVKVLNAMLGGGMSSPLFQVVREEGGLAYEVSSFYPSRRLGSAFVIYAGTDPKNLDEAQKKVLGLIKDFLRNPLSETALQNAKRYIRGHYMMDHQTNGKIAWYLGWWEILGKGHGHDAVYLKEIEAVTAADVRRAAEHLFVQPAVTVKLRSKK